MQTTYYWADILFQMMLLAQIIIVSLIIPSKIISKLKNIYKVYPPESYPKLYTKSITYYQKKQYSFLYTNYFIFLISIVLWLLGVFIYPEIMQSVMNWNANSFITFYFILQFSPVLLILGREELKQYKRMREANSDNIRKATLHRRSLMDYISAKTLGLMVFTYIAFIVFNFYIEQFNFPWFGGYWNIVGITFMNSINSAVVVWYLYGKKLNPHQSDLDRYRETKSIIHLVVGVSIFATLFVVLKILVKAVDMSQLNLFVSSLYVQILAWIQYKFIFKACSGKNMDFSVYKKQQLRA